MNIVTCSYGNPVGEHIREILNGNMVNVIIKKFPDGEIYLRIVDELKPDVPVIIINTTINTEAVLEMAFAIDAVKRFHVKKIIAVTPYFGYGRQDKQFLPGEAISASVIARMLTDGVSDFIMVEPHSDYIKKYFDCKVHIVSAASAIFEKFKDKIDLVVSPDKGGIGRAATVGKLLNTQYTYLNKKRISSYEVAMEFTDNISMNGKKILIVDDLVSTGGTIIKASELIKKAGALEIHVACTHGLFIDNSGYKISRVVDSLNTTDTVQTPYSTIPISKYIARSIEKAVDS